MNIALIYGGNSSEREISVLSGKNISGNLLREGRNVFEIDIYYDNWKLVAVNGLEIQPVQVDKNGFTVEWEESRVKFDVALLMIHGTPGEDGLFISYLEMMGIPHTGCPARVALMAFDKYACKTFLRPAGIKMPRACRITEKTLGRSWQEEASRVLGPMPWFVKPVAGGSSFGISKVREPEALLAAVEEALKEDDQILVEEYIEGTEVTNGIMKTREKAYILPVTEIVPYRECEFFDYKAKYKGASAEITPARISPELTSLVQQTTSLIYDTLVCRGIVRVDYIIRGNEVYFLEVNTVPGMTTRSLVPQEIEAAGFTLPEFLDELIRAAIDEYQRV
ncbi:MAG: D-alanine--D-alanine ligase [Bacteroidales bacterium]|jgi:D-alanine-D-alanine ligase